MTLEIGSFCGLGTAYLAALGTSRLDGQRLLPLNAGTSTGISLCHGDPVETAYRMTRGRTPLVGGMPSHPI